MVEMLLRCDTSLNPISDEDHYRLWSGFVYSENIDMLDLLVKIRLNVNHPFEYDKKYSNSLGAGSLQGAGCGRGIKSAGEDHVHGCSIPTFRL